MTSGHFTQGSLSPQQWVMSCLETSVVLALGNLLLAASLTYILVYMALRHTHSSGQENWTEHQQRKLISISHHLAVMEQLVVGLWTELVGCRKSSPVKFYMWGLAGAILLAQLGQWLPTSYLVHLLMSMVLLVPMALTYHQLHPSGIVDCWEGMAGVGRRIVAVVSAIKQEVTATRTHAHS